MSAVSLPLSMSPNSANLKSGAPQASGAVNSFGHNSAQSTPSLPTIAIDAKKQGPISKRVEVETLASELQKRLGSIWDKYQQTVSLFLLGRLSRRELIQNLSPILTDSKMIRMHNQLLLANLANSLRDGPNQLMAKKSGFGGNASGKRKKDSKVKVSSQYEKLKKDVMNLPIRERYRIKTITRESGKKSMATSALTLTRQSLLPKIPYVADKDKQFSGNTVEWTQDITHSLQVPLASESYLLPDNENLKTRMLGIAREHGITGQLGKDVVEVMSIGLETYLKFILESAIDTVRFRKRKHLDDGIVGDLKPNDAKRQKVTLTNEDIVDTLQISPFLVEPNGPVYRLHNVLLQDDCYVEEKTEIDSFLKHPRSEFVKSSNFGAISPVLEKKSVESKPNDDLPKAETTKDEPLAIKAEQKPSETPAATNTASAPAASSASAASVASVASAPDSNSGSLETLISNNVGTKDELNWLIYDILSA